MKAQSGLTQYGLVILDLTLNSPRGVSKTQLRFLPPGSSRTTPLPQETTAVRTTLVPVLEEEPVLGRVDDDVQALRQEPGHLLLELLDVPLGLGARPCPAIGLVPARRRPGRGLLQADEVGRPEDGQEAEPGQGRRGDEEAFDHHVSCPGSL